MSWEVWFAFFIMEGALCLAPGPAVMFVLANALARGPGKSVLANLGILAANAFYFFLSATSLGAVLMASYELFFAIKWVGAAYLVYLGLQTIFGGESPLTVGDVNLPAVTRRRIFAGGFALQAANPKSLLFFTALLPQFLDPEGSVGWQVAILAATSMVTEFFVLLGYGMLAGQATRWAAEPRFAAWTNRTTGTLLVGAGVGLAALRRTQ
jgi:threonine/homoserine/homoserine lactone efflux protein